MWDGRKQRRVIKYKNIEDLKDKISLKSVLSDNTHPLYSKPVIKTCTEYTNTDAQTKISFILATEGQWRTEILYVQIKMNMCD